jgi:O-antigen/teichoic acid export membrane protein
MSSASSNLSPILDAPPEAGKIRSRRIKTALITSVCSKVASLGVQLLAIPVALKALGVERYGAFVMLSSALAWMNMANFGIGPGLTKGITSSSARGAREVESRYFSTAFFIVSVFSLTLLAGYIGGVNLVSVGSLFGEVYRPFYNEMSLGIVILGVLLCLQLILSVVDSAQAGYQEQHVNNLWATFANFMSIGLLFVIANFYPTITGMIIAVFGAAIIAKIGNFCSLVLVKRPYLLPRVEYIDKKLVKAIVGTGLAFFLVQISSLINQQASVFIVGRQLGPSSVASFSVAYRLIILAASMVVMFTQPLWPAYMDAVARKEYGWVRKTYRKILLVLMSYAVVTGAVIALFGQHIIKAWVGTTVSVDYSLQVSLGLYFIVLVWGHIHYMTLIGIGNIWPAAITLLIESLLMIGLAVKLVGVFDSTGVALALLAASLLVSSWTLPLMTRRAFARFSCCNTVSEVNVL